MANTPGFTVWLTGMLGSGKTTMAAYIAARLRQVGRSVEVLDEDDVAEHLWKELGDTKDDRVAVSRRLGFVAEMLTRNGVCTLVAAASPYKAIRDENRRRIERYIEVYVDCKTDELIKRDTTGKYKKAMTGEIPDFIGITAPYEAPTQSSHEVKLMTDAETVEAGGLKVFQSLLDLAYMTPGELKIITGTKMKANPTARRPAKGAKRAAAPARAVRAAKPKAAKRKK